MRVCLGPLQVWSSTGCMEFSLVTIFSFNRKTNKLSATHIAQFSLLEFFITNSRKAFVVHFDLKCMDAKITEEKTKRNSSKVLL